MSPSHSCTSQTLIVPTTAPTKEIAPMTIRFARNLDVIASFLIVILTVATGAATAVLNA
jgi:hypothetical protein